MSLPFLVPSYAVNLLLKELSSAEFKFPLSIASVADLYMVRGNITYFIRPNNITSVIIIAKMIFSDLKKNN